MCPTKPGTFILSAQVNLLLDLIASLYPRRAGGADGVARVQPYHKSVRDFLTQPERAAAVAPEWHIDEAAAHAKVAQALMAAAGCQAGRGAEEQYRYVNRHGPDPPAETRLAPTSAVPQYALEYLVRHLSMGLPAGTQAALDITLQDYAFLHALFASGSGWAALRDLLAAASGSLGVFGQDALRWLKQSQGYLGAGMLPLVAAISAPPLSSTFRAAASHCGLDWRTTMSMGGSLQWSALELLLKVNLETKY